MSLACAYAVALVGLDGRIVEVEAHTGPGLPRTILVGLPDTSLYEARDRCKAAVHSSRQSWPNTLLTINLSPATLPKQGSGYDLAIVTAVLAAADVVKAGELRDTVLLGELGLDGRVRPVRGVLPATLAAAQAGFRRVIVPYRQAGEAQLVEGIEVLGVASLAQLIAVLQHEPVPDAEPVDLAPTTQRIGTDVALDLADVAGQLEAKWAVEVAAAGRHHLLFTGPPGVGKTMIAAKASRPATRPHRGRGVGGLGGPLPRRLRPLGRVGATAAICRTPSLRLDGEHRRRRARTGSAGSRLLRPPGGPVPG